MTDPEATRMAPPAESGGTEPAASDAVASTDGSARESWREIDNKDFPSARRGYDRAAVRAFLHTVAKRIRDLEAENRQLSGDVELAKLEVRTLEAELVDQRRRLREAVSRLELAEELRKDALARALAAEAGRQHAEDLLARVESARSPDRRPAQDVDLRDSAEPAERVREPAGARTEGGVRTEAAGQVRREVRPAAAISVILSETEEALRTRLLNHYLQTEAQVRVIEQTAEALVETTRTQAQRIVDGARQDADRITRSARQIAEAWEDVVAEVRDEIAMGDSALSNLRAATRPPAEPVAVEVPSAIETSVRFATDQARAAALALHASARDDLHLAEFWIQEAEQEAGEGAALTSRTILDEAQRLLTMAEELGHSAPELVEQYGELRRRNDRLHE